MPNVSLLTSEVPYQAILDSTVDSISTSSISEEAYIPAWEVNSTYPYDCLYMVLPFDEAILEEIIGLKKLCEDLHHKS